MHFLRPITAIISQRVKLIDMSKRLLKTLAVTVPTCNSFVWFWKVAAVAEVADTLIELIRLMNQWTNHGREMDGWMTMTHVAAAVVNSITGRWCCHNSPPRPARWKPREMDENDKYSNFERKRFLSGFGSFAASCSLSIGHSFQTQSLNNWIDTKSWRNQRSGEKNLRQSHRQVDFRIDSEPKVAVCGKFLPIASQKKSRSTRFIGRRCGNVSIPRLIHRVSIIAFRDYLHNLSRMRIVADG